MANVGAACQPHLDLELPVITSGAEPRLYDLQCLGFFCGEKAFFVVIDLRGARPRLLTGDPKISFDVECGWQHCHHSCQLSAPCSTEGAQYAVAAW